MAETPVMLNENPAESAYIAATEIRGAVGEEVSGTVCLMNSSSRLERSFAIDLRVYCVSWFSDGFEDSVRCPAEMEVVMSRAQ